MVSAISITWFSYLCLVVSIGIDNAENFVVLAALDIKNLLTVR
jgi:hypothetical protein